MNKNKLILILLLMLLTSIAKTQVVVYRTFEDFQNEIGEEYDDYHSCSHTMGNVKLKFKKGGKKIKIHCKDLWGFTYKDAFFRIHKKHSKPTRLISLGKIAYYENGVAHLTMIKNNKDSGSFSIGYFCYLSKNIGSELIPMPTNLISDVKKDIKNFKEKHPEYKDLFDCIEKDYHYLNVRPCIKEFEKSE